MRRYLLSLLVILLGGIALSGCRFPTELFFAPDSPPPNQIETFQPTSTSSDSALLQAGLTPTSTIPPCAYAQAEQSLPDVSARIQDQLSKAGLGSIEALAVAYGENCVDTLHNTILSFSAIETDFFFTAVVADTEDKASLGDLTLRLLAVAEQFPPGEVPGPNLGYLNVVFQDSGGSVQLHASLADAARVRDGGLRGAQFYAALGGG